MASTYLTHTHGSTATLSTKGTFSCWVKRSAVAGEQTIFTGNDGSNRDFVRFESTSILRTRGCAGAWDLQTTQKFRDVHGWYHIVVSVDTTQSTNSNRVKVYVNGSQITSFGTATYPSQDYALLGWSGNGKLQTLGRDGTNNAGYLDGALSHVYWIDGTAYDASAFGETDATTGEWEAKTSPSVTYGNNGFFILKDGNSVTDQSGNSNNFTVAGGTVTDLKDNPENTFATMNSLDNLYQSATFSNGNNTIVTSDTAYAATMSTLGMTSGKYYAEMKATNIGNGYSQFGIRGTFVTSNAQGAGQGADGYAYIANGGQKRNNDSSSAYGTTWNSGDIIGCAVDLDNNYIYFSRNGTWQNSGDPTSGSSGTGAAFSLGTPSSGAYFFAASDNDADVGTANTFDFNFGNGYFGTTAVSSAGTNASDNGIFEYDVPTGYTALSTKGLNL
jgi:hypothetical protein